MYDIYHICSYVPGLNIIIIIYFILHVVHYDIKAAGCSWCCLYQDIEMIEHY